MLKPKYQQVAQLYAESRPVKEIAEKTGYHLKHVYQILKKPEIEAEIQEIRSNLAKQTDWDIERFVEEIKKNYYSYNSSDARHKFLKLLGETLGYTGKGSTVNVGIGVNNKPFFADVDQQLKDIIAKRLGK